MAPSTPADKTVPETVDFYERQVLPVLFERLDRAFPEFQWTRKSNGWTGVLPAGTNGVHAVEGRTVRCRQPWGFTDVSGRTISWLAYVSGEKIGGRGDLTSAVRELARRASVDESFLSNLWTSANRRATQAYERQRELQEAFVAYCHLKLCSSDGHAAMEYLQRVHGINGHETSDFPLGVYTSRADIHDYLRGVGFSDEEISASKVVRDERLAGRVIIPWRDRWGNIRTVVAHDASGQLHGRPRQLYRKCDATEDAFGLDFSLRPTSGGLEHLILVEGLLDVVYFQTHGLNNVAAFGGTGKVPTSAQWERLADHGIRQVTLALADDPVGWERTLAALGNSYQAERAPQVFALTPQSLGSSRGVATFARLNGVGRFRQVVAGRLHGFHFVAQALIKEYKDGEHWTDAGLIDLLTDAVEFDARVYTPARELELERFFWPPILAALGARWDAVCQLLRRPLDVPEPVAVEPAPPARPARHVIPPPPPAPVIHPPTVEFRQPASKPVVRQKAPAKPAPPAEPLPVDVTRLAYEIWQRKGCPVGRDQDCWFEALELVRRRQAEGERIYAKTA
ncbi:MAG: DUF2934 domain-containing protein [Planctomycetota bacterium]|nr:DUF2934 domain-containing protein [Planctomycetota bacterium]